MTDSTIHSHYEEAEQDLRSRVLAMGGMVEEMMRTAVDALLRGDAGPLAEVHRREVEVNGMHREVDEKCMTLIARFQPAASDLRFVMAVIRVNADLERVGDQAVNIAQNTQALLGLPEGGRMLLDIPLMASLAAGMLKDALDAFTRGDSKLALTVSVRDDAEDELKRESFYEVARLMQANPSNIPAGMALLLISRNMEKIADHANNIAKEVIFMESGMDIRHPGISGSGG